MSLIHKCKDYKPLKTTKIRKLYREEIDEDGCPYLVEDGEYNESDEVQSYYDSVRLDKILERIAYGDTSLLRPESSLQYGNADLPSDPFAVLALKKESERKFNDLPDEIKAIYNNDITAFADDIVTKGIEEIARKYEQSRPSDSGAGQGSNS